MIPMTHTILGRVFATPSAVTIIMDGVEVFSGQVGIDQPLDTQLNLFQTTLAKPTGNSSATYSVTMSVTSGVVTVGDTTVQYPDGNYVYMLTDPDQGTDLRENILVNGSLPEWPATPVDPMPGGTSSSPDWQGWFFELAAGESMTFDYTLAMV